jgi:hypothetical protein
VQKEIEKGREKTMGRRDECERESERARERELFVKKKQ